MQIGQLIDTLIQELHNKKRVLFVTTGKTGGTGLNLGEFDGVIHYELPFTSIELEQRFGRVDRIDTQQDTKERDMIFILNECNDDENDNEMNRMLYYCITKIDRTCERMPVRNTVLYYPEFIRRNGERLIKSLEAESNNEVLSEENETEAKKYKRELQEIRNKIKKQFSKIYSSAENADIPLNYGIY